MSPALCRGSAVPGSGAERGSVGWNGRQRQRTLAGHGPEVDYNEVLTFKVTISAILRRCAVRCPGLTSHMVRPGGRC